jgi:MarR family
MTKTGKTSSKPNSEQAILAAVGTRPEMTAAEVAEVAKVGRSTAGKILARLADSGEIARVRGGREGARRLPDRFSPAATGKQTDAATKASVSATNRSGTERLKPGQLDGLVLSFMQKNADSGPHAPTAVAKALDRSSGAVGNCLKPRLLHLMQAG